MKVTSLTVSGPKTLPGCVAPGRPTEAFTAGRLSVCLNVTYMES